MKKFIGYLLALLIIGSCQEDDRGPFTKNSNIPGEVSEVVATSLPGGARLTYTMPADKDLLYVMAEYTLASGKVAEVKSSLYQNFLDIYGFGDTEQHEVKLYSVNRSENKSNPVPVMVTPLTPPVMKIGASIKLREDFGGVNVEFANEDKAPVAIIVYTRDEFDELVEADVMYTSMTAGNFAVRGYDTIPREFVVRVRDRYDNFSTPVATTVKPIFEQSINKTKFAPVYLTHDFKADGVFSNWTITKLWDGNLGGQGVHTAQGAFDPNGPPYLPEYPDGNDAMFTFDLNASDPQFKVRLSRFKLYQRGSVDAGQANSWGYKHGNPKKFDMWGYTPTAANPAPPTDGTLTGWVKLLSDAHVAKPSGSAAGIMTNEDLAALFAGHEFVFPLDAPPVKYIRFVCRENYSGTKFVHFMEVDFWGQIQK